MTLAVPVVRGGQQVTHGVHPAALPARSLEAASDRFDQSGVGVGDHQAHTGKASVDESGEELAPERFVLAVADVDAEHFTVPVSAESGGDHDRFGDDAAVFAYVDVGGVEPYVHERLVIQPAAAQHGHIRVDLGADPRHRRLRHPRFAAQRFDEIVDFPGRGPGDVGGHDHRPQGPVDTPAGFEQLGEERTGAQFRDTDLDVPGGGRHQLRAMPVALRDTFGCAFTGSGADRRGQLGLDQLLQSRRQESHDDHHHHPDDGDRLLHHLTGLTPEVGDHPSRRSPPPDSKRSGEAPTVVHARPSVFGHRRRPTHRSLQSPLGAAMAVGTAPSSASATRPFSRRDRPESDPRLLARQRANLHISRRSGSSTWWGG